MAEINLLGNETIDPASITAKGLKLASSSLFGALVLVVLSYAYFSYSSWATAKTIKTTQTKIASTSEEIIKNPKRLEVITRQGQAKEASSIISKHLYWSYILPEISRVTLVSSTYTRIGVDDKGKLELTVVVPTYEDLEKYIKVFNLPEFNQQFSNVKVNSITKVDQNGQLQVQALLRLDFNTNFLKDRIK